MLRASGGWKFEQRDAVDTRNCKKRCLHQKNKLSFEYVSLTGNI